MGYQGAAARGSPRSGRFGALGAVAGSSIAALAFHWDITYHVDVGRDTFWSLPHLMVIAGLAIGILATAASLRAGSTGLGQSIRDRPGTLLAFTGGIFALGILGFDEWWHSLFGIDLAVWSPPHLLLTMGFHLMLWGGILEITRQKTSPYLPPSLAGIYLGNATILLLEFELGVPHFRVLWEPLVLALFFGLSLGFAWRRTRHPLAGTITVTSALIFRLAGTAINAGFGHSLPVLPLGILFGGVSLDLIRRFSRSATDRIKPGTALALAWLVALGTNGVWRHVAGRTSWELGVIAFAIPVGTVLALLGLKFGAWLTRVSRPRRREASAEEPREEEVLVLSSFLTGAVVLAGVIAITGIPLVSDSSDESKQGSLVKSGTEVQLKVESSWPGDSVTIFGLVGGKEPKTVWLGRLDRRGPTFAGSVRPNEFDTYLVWLQQEDRAWLGVMRSLSDNMVQLNSQPFRPPTPLSGWEAPFSSSLVLVLTTLAVTVLYFGLRWTRSAALNPLTGPRS